MMRTSWPASTRAALTACHAVMPAMLTVEASSNDWPGSFDATSDSRARAYSAHPLCMPLVSPMTSSPGLKLRHPFPDGLYDP